MEPRLRHSTLSTTDPRLQASAALPLCILSARHHSLQPTYARSPGSKYAIQRPETGDRLLGNKSNVAVDVLVLPLFARLSQTSSLSLSSSPPPPLPDPLFLPHRGPVLSHLTLFRKLSRSPCHTRCIQAQSSAHRRGVDLKVGEMPASTRARPPPRNFPTSNPLRPPSTPPLLQMADPPIGPMATQTVPLHTAEIIGVHEARAQLEERNGLPHCLARPCVVMAVRRVLTIPYGRFARAVGVSARMHTRSPELSVLQYPPNS